MTTDFSAHGRHKLEVNNLCKSYGTVKALDDVSLAMPEGELLTVLGPSGSGKTTLLMAVAGLIQSSSGEIWIDGSSSTNLPPHKRNIGMVFQNYALFPHLSVADNVAFPLRMRGIEESEVRRECTRALEIVKLAHVLDRFPSQLSGGQQQRVALARCLVFKPPLVLMDEPMGALDKNLRDELQLEIRRIHREVGTTIMYVTHDQEEALVLSDRICLMNAGRIEQIATPWELYRKPRSQFAARFIGESNRFHGKVVSKDKGEIRVTSNGKTILAYTDTEFEIGSEVLVFVRPERCRVLKGKEPADNVTSGYLKERILMGNTVRTFVTGGCGEPLVVVSLSSGDDEGTAPGSEIRVGWDMRDAMVVPDATD